MRHHRRRARYRPHDLPGIYGIVRVVRLPVMGSVLNAGWWSTGRGATQVAILDLRREDAEQAGNEMVAKFGVCPASSCLPVRFRPLHDLIEKYSMCVRLSRGIRRIRKGPARGVAGWMRRLVRTERPAGI